MKVPRNVGRRALSLFSAFAILVAAAAPVALAGSASAAQITTRSLTMSNSAAGATGVTYELDFTLPGSADSLMIVFCNNTPIVGQVCTAPTGFTAAGVGDSSGGTASQGDVVNEVEYTGVTMTGATEIVLTGLTNPTSATTSSTGFYARIMTYADSTYGTYDDADTIGNAVDTGGIAMSITNPIEVSAAVRETMTFCVSKAAPGVGCGTSGQAVTTPTVELGEGTPKALTTTDTSTDTVYSQISTNASGGAVVRMKTNNTCGGLQRAGAAGCDIAPVATGNNAIAAGTAMFGMKLGTPAEAAVSTGAGTITRIADYSTGSNYGMNWVSGNATGVGSTYGDPIYDSTSAPVMNMNVPMTFGASSAATTPAGLYRATLNLVATGTF